MYIMFVTSELIVQAVGPSPDAKQIKYKHIPIIVMNAYSKFLNVNNNVKNKFYFKNNSLNKFLNNFQSINT